MTGLAREYGEGLYELARDEELRPMIHEQLEDISALLKAEPEFIRLLCSRAVERAARLKIVDDTFANHVHPYVTNFMKLLVEKEHFDAFLLCCQWFHQRYNEDYGIVEARVTSAVALNEEERAALRVRLSKISGRQVSLIEAVDPSVIGGVRVEMDGKRYDNTIQDRLGRLKRSLTQGL
ncbi:MAG: ATP synthase F1 subunit delta [Clostridia bacterium]|nr:ATP synthase F1 subunit delta [Clostridia bacterium]